jgi:hypothetical protein
MQEYIETLSLIFQKYCFLNLLLGEQKILTGLEEGSMNKISEKQLGLF